MNMVTWSIHRPVPVVVLFVALSLAGIVGFKKLGVQDRPDLDIPTVTVSVNYPGVPPSQLETEVTRKIEDSVASATGIDHIRSTVTEGLSTTVIEFQLERDVNEAVDDVRDAVTRIRSNLPAEIEEPIISRATTAGSPVVTYGVASPGMSEAELSWFVDLTISRELSSVDGVGAVKRVGGVDREIRVDLDPDALNALGTTAGDISRQLRRTQVELPGGEARIGDQEQSVRTVAHGGFDPGPRRRCRSCCPMVAAYASTPWPGARPGRRTAASGAARRQANRGLRGHPRRRARARSAWRMASQRSVEKVRARYPGIQITEVSNTVGLRPRVLQRLDHHAARGRAPRDHRRLDLPARLARHASFRAIALPLSVHARRSGFCIYVAGYTMNMMTMLALSLVVGILVDDAIVEVENIVRHLRMGKTPLKAAEEAVQEIGLAVVATSAHAVRGVLACGIHGAFRASSSRRSRSPRSPQCCARCSSRDRSRR